MCGFVRGGTFCDAVDSIAIVTQVRLIIERSYNVPCNRTYSKFLFEAIIKGDVTLESFEKYFGVIAGFRYGICNLLLKRLF